jgi:endonuclease-3 related protein
MPSLDVSYPEFRLALIERYGLPRALNTGREPFEALVATVLGKALDGPKLNAALDALRDDGLLDPQTMAAAAMDEITEALTSAGLRAPRAVLAPLPRLARWLDELHHGSIEELTGLSSRVATEQIREELSAINGLGPVTADAALLHAFGRPTYPLDRATYRVLARHGWIEPEATREEAREVIESLAPDEPGELARLWVWFAQIGKDHCRSSAPRCERCPLRPYLPQTGPVDSSED